MSPNSCLACAASVAGDDRYLRNYMIYAEKSMDYILDYVCDIFGTLCDSCCTGHRHYYFSSDAHVWVVLSGYLGAGSVGPRTTISSLSWVVAHQTANHCVQGSMEKQYWSFRRLDIDIA